MTQCFVIQPFDNGPFDARFEDTYKPALEEAGLEVYRVDKDPKTQNIIQAIEEGIKNSPLCFADISEDNPNVWYELGYALASGCLVILICLNSRTEFPFDVRHLNIITYTTSALRDHKKLQGEITKHAQSLVNSIKNSASQHKKSQVTQDGVLTMSEMRVLAEVAKSNVGSANIPSINELLWQFRKRNLIKEFECSLSINRLETRGFIEAVDAIDPQVEYVYRGLKMKPAGWQWLDKNSGKYGLE